MVHFIRAVKTPQNAFAEGKKEQRKENPDRRIKQNCKVKGEH